MDNAANNYDSDALVDDGSCEFDPEVVESEDLADYDSSEDIDLPEVELDDINIDIDVPAGSFDVEDGTEITMEVSEASEDELQDIIDSSSSTADVEVYSGLSIDATDENGDPIELVDGATLDILLTFDPSSRSTYDVGYITEDGEIIALGADCGGIDGGSSYACEADGPGFGSYIVYSYDPDTAISGCTDSNACNLTEEATLMMVHVNIL
jgi:hypothetical protein